MKKAVTSKSVTPCPVLTRQQMTRPLALIPESTLGR